MKEYKEIISAPDKDFFYAYKNDETISPDTFQIHSHKSYEVLIFIKGDASFAIEGSFFPISPMDVLITRPGEMHQICHHSNGSYERIMLTITDDFFINNDCIRYRDIFTEREIGEGNILHLGEEELTEMMNISSRIERYISRNENNEVVIRSAIIEFLYELNRLKPSNRAKVRYHELVLRTTAYINQNLSGNLSLEIIAKELFTSKTYLCRIFKQNTGITIGQYITKKRFLKATALIKSGHSLSSAAMIAGFSDYSSFYKTCVAETGNSPRKNLRL